MNYKLRTELLGHTGDVRSVAVSRDLIITGSRDKTAKVWRIDNSNEISELITLKSHENYVSCVYYWKSGEQGFFVTASHDKKIIIYSENNFEEPLILAGHDGPVCAFAKGHLPGYCISGSWDTTARIWHINFETKTFESKELKGHESAVWAVASSKRLEYITGAADKMIFFWNAQGERTKILKGHTDCVRGLIELGDHILSCSNDATIRVWDQNGECQKQLEGHTAYIYSMALIPCEENNLVVSCGEDSSIRIWDIFSGKEVCEPILLPAQSVWSVACSPSGDIFSGSSDAICRVFTARKELQAPEAHLKAFNDSVQLRKAQISQSIGNIKKTDLPGPEGLLKPGKDGQTKMIRQNDGKVECFQWENGSWVLLGEVMGAPDENSTENKPKTTYNGKEYDYVFSVDVETGTPLKLPYNLDEDPWNAAQKFIHLHSLPQEYLDKVANFIITNSNQNMASYKRDSGSTAYFDPFTGESRYTPGNNRSDLPSVGNTDPFTSSSSYSSASAAKEEDILIPSTEVIILTTCNIQKIHEKLSEYNKLAGVQAVDQNQLDNVVNLMKPNYNPNIEDFQTLRTIIHWSKDILFPGLDILRLITYKEHLYKMWKTTISIEELFRKFSEHINSSVANKLMIIRCLINMMYHQTGKQDLIQKFGFVIDIIRDNFQDGNANMQVAYSTLYYNFSVLFLECNEPNGSKILEGTEKLLSWITDEAAIFRCLQALGNLLCCSDKLLYSRMLNSSTDVTNALMNISSNSKNLDLQCITLKLLKALNY